MEVIVVRSQNKQKAIYWSKVVDNFKESNLSVSDFAKKHRISSNKLSYWKLRLAKGDHAKRKNDFIEIKEASSNKGSMTLSLDNVITLKFSSPPSPEWISKLLHSVKEVA